jgi:hypothetical protein
MHIRRGWCFLHIDYKPLRRMLIPTSSLLLDVAFEDSDWCIGFEIV